MELGRSHCTTTGQQVDKKSDGVATTWGGGEKESEKTANSMERRLPEGLAENGRRSETVVQNTKGGLTVRQ